MGRVERYVPLLFFILALLLAAVFHGFNMFAFPYFESDEGTYMSQAWAVMNHGSLSPYTYWYDHPPGGWIFIGLWTLLFSDGFFAFGTSIETGRVFMLVIHIASAALIFHIMRFVTKRSLPAFAACLFFSISPLAIYFQRRVLIDGLMVFWFLAAVAVLCLAYDRIRLRHFVLSAIFFAFAVLTKLTAVFFGPAFLYFLWTHNSPVPRNFRMTFWILIAGMMVSMFFLFAILSNELFSSAEGGTVSFMDAVAFQSSRSGGVFWSPESAFASAIRDWADKDFLFTLLVLTILGSAVFMMPFFKNVRFFLLSMIPYIFFLTSGGVNFNFYILPLIPIVVMTWALYIHNILSFLSRRMYILSFVAILGAICYYYWAHAPRDHFIRDETTNQKNATIWIKENLDNETVVLIDNFAYVDLHDPGYINDKTFPNADWYYKVSRDVEVGVAKYQMDWRNFDYLSLTHEMIKQIQDGNDPIIRNAYDHGFPQKKWTQNRDAFLDLPKMISTNGDWTMLYAIGDQPYEMLLNGWRDYRERTFQLYGKMVDPETELTTSEAQANALLQAVMTNDEEAFKGVWLWTHDHIQSRVQDKLFSSSWGGDAIIDSNNHTGADADIALALIQAAYTWEEPTYGIAAKGIIDQLWKHTIATVDGRYYPLPNNKISARRYENKYLLSPARFSPLAYRIFAEVDPEHDWNKLADDAYLTLEEISDQTWNTSGLPLTWVALDYLTGEISPAGIYFDEVAEANSFTPEASGALFRVSADLAWFPSEEGLQYLTRINGYLDDLAEEDGTLPTQVGYDGSVISWERSYVSEASYLSARMWQENSRDINLYVQRMSDAYSPEYTLLTDESSYRDENAAWFGLALYHGVYRNILEHQY